MKKRINKNATMHFKADWFDDREATAMSKFLGAFLEKSTNVLWIHLVQGVLTVRDLHEHGPILATLIMGPIKNTHINS